jgi:site-specific recombinase
MVENQVKYITLMVSYVVAMAMGIVSIVLSVLGEPIDIVILAIAVAALGFAGINSLDKE